MRFCGIGIARSRGCASTAPAAPGLDALVEVEQRALHPLASEAFPLFASGERTVHTDGHVEVAGAFYPVPLALLGQRVRVRWDAHLVRIFDGDTLVMVHARVAAGVFAPRAGEAEASTVSKRLSIGSSGNVSASVRRSSSGPTRPSPRVASAPFASFKPSSP
jgi:hypothetical protein